jgi:succinate-semialdehyde dehydrogenase/glutarate-semialdehyde dehydrogenase
MIGLADTSLLRSTCLIGGRWIAGNGEAIDVVDPASGSTIARVHALTDEQVVDAIDAAVVAQAAWGDRSAKDRADILRRLFDLMCANREDLARIIVAEQGKPLAEARGEVSYAASFVEWFSEEAKRTYGETIPSPWPGSEILTFRRPIGVFAAITPWNFPLAMIARKVGAGWAAGCAGIIRPDSATPLTALAFALLAERAGLPAGVCNVVIGDPVSTGKLLCASEKVRKLSFTGSTPVGAILLAQCAPTVKKVSMELGGNAPFIVFDDADVDAAVAGAIAAKYRNSGQTCVCANRFYVQAGIHDRFVEGLVAAVDQLKVGRGLEPGAEQGPLIHARALAKVEAHVADALARGGRVATGGARHALGGTFYQPTVLVGLPADAAIFREETFGPVAAVRRFEEEDEVVALANDTPFGLAAYLYSRDVGRVFRVARRLEVGMVGINTGTISTEVAPFGGVKASGMGREGSAHGIESYLEIQYLNLGR